MRSKRLEQLPPYLFVEIDRLKESALRSGRKLFDLGIGDPDLGAPRELVTALERALSDASHHRYPPGRGLNRLIDSIRAWVLRRYGLEIDRDEVLVTIGSKEAIAHLPLAIVNPGDAVLVPDPGYPVYYSSAVFAGASCVRLPLSETNGFLPRFDEIDPRALSGARLLFLNYPNNPTAAVAGENSRREAIEFCGRRGIVLASDAAYGEIWYEEPAVPFFPSARDAGIPYIEFFSFSKTFSITGWRIGFAIGSREIVAALSQLKNNIDSGVFGAIQEAVADTMDHHYERISTIRAGCIAFDGTCSPALSSGRGSRSRCRRRPSISGFERRPAGARWSSAGACSRNAAWSLRRASASGRRGRGISGCR